VILDVVFQESTTKVLAFFL